MDWKPWEREVWEAPEVTYDSDTGYGAEFIPIMRTHPQSTSDLPRTRTGTTGISDGITMDDVVRPLIGITTVIDCPTTDHQ